jgi:microcystin-dependent protein
MVDTITPNILLTNQTEGGNDNTWGVIADANFEQIDDVLGDTTAVVTTGGTTVLTDEQELVAAVDVSGTLVSNATIEFSGRGGFWIVANLTTGDFTVTVKVTGETGVVIPQGTAQLIWCDGDDIRLGNTDPSAAGEVTVASAATTDILGAGSEYIAISGTGTITSFGTGPSVKRFVRATGAFTITHHGTSLICPGGSNILAAAGDTFIVISDASSNARIIMYQRAAAPPQAVPISAVMDYAGSTAPAFWLLCFGQAVSRTTYAALFAAIGVTYGAGDASTTFNLPDLRGRVVAGKDDMGGSSANRLTNQSGGLNGDTLGASGGVETHTLASGEMPSHTHGAGTLANSSEGAHRHFVSNTDNGSIDDLTASNSVAEQSGGSSDLQYLLRGSATTPTLGRTDEVAAHAHTISGSTGSTGSGSAHNNVQPTLILNKIIFAGV